MIRAALAFFAVWGLVFLGISFLWHSPVDTKLKMFRNAVYSLGTAVVAFAIMFTLVILF